MNKQRVSEEKSFIIDEHKRLDEMISSLVFFIENMRNSSIGPDAIDVLHDRIQDHFRLEEEIAKQYDETSANILHDAHERLLSILGSIKTCQKQGNDEQAKLLLTTFTEALTQHDREVDLPLFTEITAKANRQS